MNQFCFTDGAAILAKGRDGRSGSTAERADKVGARRRRNPVELPSAKSTNQNFRSSFFRFCEAGRPDRRAGLGQVRRAWSRTHNQCARRPIPRPCPKPSPAERFNLISSHSSLPLQDSAFHRSLEYLQTLLQRLQLRRVHDACPQNDPQRSPNERSHGGLARILSERSECAGKRAAPNRGSPLQGGLEI